MTEEIPCTSHHHHSYLYILKDTFLVGESFHSPEKKMYHNYINPIFCVATVCHQVCCIYWGHLDHFHRAISHFKWYKIIWMRYFACIFCHMKSIDMFSMFLQSGIPRHFLWRFIAVWKYNLTVLCLCMSMLTSNSSGNMQKHGCLGCFHAASTRENIAWVWVIIPWMGVYQVKMEVIQQTWDGFSYRLCADLHIGQCKSEHRTNFFVIHDDFFKIYSWI